MRQCEDTQCVFHVLFQDFLGSGRGVKPENLPGRNSLPGGIVVGLCDRLARMKRGASAPSTTSLQMPMMMTLILR